MKLIHSLFAGLTFGIVALTTSAALAETVALPDKQSVLTKLDLANTYWQAQHADTGTNDWKSSVYHIGNLAAASASANSSYLSYGNGHADKHRWLINRGTFTEHADPQAIGQVYLGLTTDSTKLADVVSQTNKSYDKNLYTAWTWIDAIFMQMNTFTQMGIRYGNSTRNYHNQMWNMYNHTKLTLGLFDSDSKLWFRDIKYKDRTNTNGKKILWSRGNGWVFASLATTLDTLPTTDPHYNDYKATFTAMADSLSRRQQPDGFWYSNLDDPAHNRGPESSGTSAFAYGYAVGIRKGILSKAIYQPVLAKAWTALSTVALQSNGLLGYCQRVGEAPGSTSAGETQNYCVGLFLLAATAVSQIAPAESTPNLALNRTVTFSSQQVGNEADHAVDGTVATRWSAQTYPQWIRVDLGSAMTISQTELRPYQSRAYQFKVEVSKDGRQWDQVVDRTGNTTPASSLTDKFTPIAARYVRLTITGASGYTGNWISISEFAVTP